VRPQQSVAIHKSFEQVTLGIIPLPIRLAFIQPHSARVGVESKREESHLIEVALFPIPDVVAFPGVPIPLHVFEPRYRQLVQDCVADERLLGVCHTQKTIHKPATSPLDPPSLEKQLSSNQATYKPHPEERQSLPYRIVGCEPLPDDPPQPEQILKSTALQERIHTRLLKLVSADNPELAEQLRSADWQALSAEDYSYQIFGCLRFDADIMQQILESTSATQRLAAISQLLDSI